MKIYQITVLASLRPVFNVVVVEDVGEVVSVSPSFAHEANFLQVDFNG